MLKLSSYKVLTRAFLFISLVSVFNTNALAQAEVVEAGAGVNFSQEQNNTPTASASDSNDIVLNLYLQLEALQQEVQTLRGLVEEQSYQIRRMQTESRDRYLDIDSRLSNLTSSSAPSAISTPSNTLVDNASNQNFIPVRGALDAPNTSPLLTPSVGPQAIDNNSGATLVEQNVISSVSTLAMPENEQDLYRTALNLLVEDSNYEDSISLFQQYIDVYSEGRYIANAYYWQGEALILVERFNQAKEAFGVVINNYPLHSKAPGAMLKLVVTYIQMNDMGQANQTVQNLRSQYPNSLTEISAAEDYLNKAGI